MADDTQHFYETVHVGAPVWLAEREHILARLTRTVRRNAAIAGYVLPEGPLEVAAAYDAGGEFAEPFYRVSVSGAGRLDPGAAAAIWPPLEGGVVVGDGSAEAPYRVQGERA